MTLGEVRALARVGAAEAAWAALESIGPREDAPALTLRGRLLKDRAAALDGAARTALLRKAADAYAAAAKLAPATYPLINAATLSLLGGAPARAAQRAAETLALLESGAHEPDTDYWLGATRAEALLLLGREIEARAALREAIAGTPRAWEDHAVTLKQFRLILAEQGRAADWLDPFRPPAAVHFAGPIGVGVNDLLLEWSLDSALAAIRPGTAIGALAAGFDIVAAEILQRGGAQLHLILPGSIDAFVEASVRPFGGDWLARFERLLADATAVETSDAPEGMSAAAVALAEEMALGLTAREARMRGADAVMLRIKGAGPDRAVAGNPALRLVEVTGGEVATPGGAASLEPPARPTAILGCGPGLADELGRLAGNPARVTSLGALAAVDDLAEAAGIATALFDADRAGGVALDYGISRPGRPLETARVELLLAIPPRGFPLATCAAALALEARGAPFQTAVAGGSTHAASSFDFFSLWRSAPAATSRDR